VSDAPMALLNHVTACAYCYPQSDKYCEAGKALHAASKPSLGVNSVRSKPVAPKLDVRRELYTHLLACRDCLVEHHVFCSAVSVVGSQYTDWLENTDHGKPITDVKREFIDLVVAGRIKKWKQLNELKQI
jgi:hypothetical protein